MAKNTIGKPMIAKPLDHDLFLFEEDAVGVKLNK